MALSGSLPQINLGVQGLALRGTEEVFGSPRNGNFMGALELLDEFDHFICELIEQRELRPKSLKYRTYQKQYMSK
ncbi:hypothetical protein TNCV_345391 [Trichonephila clavipes]|nr:hypothetical protein TNCV_345391 [Trichonephila clavipes]